MLLIASYFFYMCYQTELVVLIFGTTLVSWIASRIIEKSDKVFVKAFLCNYFKREIVRREIAGIDRKRVWKQIHFTTYGRSVAYGFV